jgi:hypothetical protein
MTSAKTLGHYTIAVVLFAFVLVLTSSTEGRADPPPALTDLPPEMTELYAEDTSNPSSDPTIEAVIGGTAYGCYGYTDNPHESGHNSGNAITLVRTECSIQASRQYANGEMYRDRWDGLQKLDEKSSSKFYTYGKVRAIPSWYCNGAGTYTYRTWGYHEVTQSGTVYWGDTYNDNRFTC